ncbi:uncharacterized protein T551_00416 [Pneumocystis jirovecii RU7]|uniref:RNA exonuclease 4 n=1 Tax=Pneumocystis jirovecii (strain RU7) TaxID=1408657 RepID=A0A0W4ZVC4_PNEJ7|nr:uncharacterized protein T551_00416 [Pneumocystis jirovecii RU7]KTW32326.1 hypothetical protein T551_00416 [Pneumocystis jirovecii RU7]
MYSLSSDNNVYVPSCNWRRLQKSLHILGEIRKKTKKRIIKTDLNKFNSIPRNNNEIKCPFSISKQVFCKQINESKKNTELSKKDSNYQQKTRKGKYIALDCEMVQVGPSNKKDRVLARISIVNYYGNVIFDTFVKPKERVIDYKTHINGITQADLKNAPSFEEVQSKVADLLKNRILVGHSLKNDLDVLLLSHPKKDIRDTSKFKTFKAYSKGKSPALKKLAKEILNMTIQNDVHSSIEDARAAMLLYRRYKHEMDHA